MQTIKAYDTIDGTYTAYTLGREWMKEMGQPKGVSPYKALKSDVCGALLDFLRGGTTVDLPYWEGETAGRKAYVRWEWNSKKARFLRIGCMRFSPTVMRKLMRWAEVDPKEIS
jgi:hypothetical protein